MAFFSAAPKEASPACTAMMSAVPAPVIVSVFPEIDATAGFELVNVTGRVLLAVALKVIDPSPTFLPFKTVASQTRVWPEATTVRVPVTEAGLKLLSPGWVTVMVVLPCASKSITPAEEIVATAGVELEYVKFVSFEEAAISIVKSGSVAARLRTDTIVKL